VVEPAPPYSPHGGIPRHPETIRPPSLLLVSGGPTVDATIDVRDLLAAAVEGFEDALEERPPSDRREGQLAYLEAARDALEAADGEAAVDEVLEEAAEAVGLGVDGAPDEATAREAGAREAWSLCLGYAQGAHDGVQEAVAALDDDLGLEAEFLAG
jgi:hypothetical protein